jgi:hypothetical protein
MYSTCVFIQSYSVHTVFIQCSYRVASCVNHLAALPVYPGLRPGHPRVPTCTHVGTRVVFRTALFRCDTALLECDTALVRCDAAQFRSDAALVRCDTAPAPKPKSRVRVRVRVPVCACAQAVAPRCILARAGGAQLRGLGPEGLQGVAKPDFKRRSRDGPGSFC